ncbi:hypothetical protein J8281_13460 [Aquimarina sp. U1-2]|uniref:hypothetical protein n=1 Tax=Aquimarina sp. U1-2 TaxID=2823141 RepID=UPI001AECC054|nr:hypothetical protein [Aquimarina sp. U1-2]MBP2833196.1 hypothetical protein [Aquimarina sp. U1-2]
MKVETAAMVNRVLYILLLFIIYGCDRRDANNKDITIWKPLGNTIKLSAGENRTDLIEMSISADGSKVAIIDYFQQLDTTLPSKKIATFELRDSIWSSFGNTHTDSTHFTNAQVYAMSSDASRIVTGQLAYNLQQIQTFDRKNKNWTLINDTSVVRKPSSYSWLQNVKLSANGKTLAISSPVLVNSTSEVQVYSWKNKGWIPKGNAIPIKDKMALNYGGANFYWNNVNLNEDGSIITIANIYNYDNGPDAGQVKVFKYSDSIWKQVGNDINGDLPYQNLGTSVTIRPDGKSLMLSSSSRIKDRQFLQYNLENKYWVQQKNYIPSRFYDNAILKLSKEGNILLSSSDYEGYSGKAYTIYIHKRINSDWKIIGRIDENHDHFNEVLFSENQNRLFILFDGFRDKYIKVFTPEST